MSECFDDSALAQLFAVAAEGVDREAVDAHVAECDACRRLVGTYARLFAEEADGAQGDRRERQRGIDLQLPSTGLLARAWADAQIGRTLSERWTLRRVIGLGGSAVVFEAEHKNGSRVAIKVLRPEHHAIAPLMGRFLREAYVANKIDHPGVVRVIDDGTTEEGAPFLVMDLLTGETLRERVERTGPLDEGATTELGAAVLSVLERAHARGIVHRDLKPDNVFFDEQQRVRVLDFGIARMARPAPDDEGLTETGLGMGTSAYMPPEQARGDWKAVGPATDLWALAATLMYALTKRPPHVADNAQQTLIAAATTPAPKLAKLAPHVTVSLAVVIDQALSFEPDRRPADASTMRQALLAAREHRTSAVSPKKRFGAAIGLAFLLVPLGCVVIFVRMGGEPRAPEHPIVAATEIAAVPTTAPSSTLSVTAMPQGPASATASISRPATPPVRPNSATAVAASVAVAASSSVPPEIATASSSAAVTPSASATPGEILRRRH